MSLIVSSLYPAIKQGSPTFLFLHRRRGHSASVDKGRGADYISALLHGVVPKWSKGVVCKTIIRRFESDPRLRNNEEVKSKKYSDLPAFSFFPLHFLFQLARVVELVDTRDLKSLGL